jgi:hypothetical protein
MTEPCFGHDSGTFIIEESKIYSENQELGNLNRSGQKTLQGNYYGISVLERSTISGVSGIK